MGDERYLREICEKKRETSHRSNRWNSHRVCVLGDIFVLFLCKIENPLFFTFTKDSRFYIGKARKYHPKRTPYGCSSDLTYAMFREFLCANLSGITSITHSLWKNYSRSILEHFHSTKKVFYLFSTKNYWDGVTTYLLERDIWMRFNCRSTLTEIWIVTAGNQWYIFFISSCRFAHTAHRLRHKNLKHFLKKIPTKKINSEDFYILQKS